MTLKDKDEDWLQLAQQAKSYGKKMLILELD